jgi:hypothetical protein
MDRQEEGEVLAVEGLVERKVERSKCGGGGHPVRKGSLRLHQQVSALLI